MANRAHFSPKTFSFLRDLAKNNDRDWFQANKPRYEQHLRDPLLSFIGDFAGPLQKISSHYRADPRPNGGSMFRIYRDTRFSKDKSPYKTQGSAHFRHEQAKNVHAPGFYLHLEPGNVFMGAGIWRPESKVANMIREAIAEDPKAWTRATGGKAFKANFALSGDALKRPPRGFDADHPLIDELRRKDFIAVSNFTQKQACSADFQSEFVKRCKAAAPLMRFLTESLELPY